MFGLSFMEIAFIMLIAFLIFGPEQFPLMLKQAIGLIAKIKSLASQAQSGFHKLSSEIEGQINPIKEDLQKQLTVPDHTVSTNSTNETQDNEENQQYFISEDANNYEDRPLAPDFFYECKEQSPNDYSDQPIDPEQFQFNPKQTQ